MNKLILKGILLTVVLISCNNELPLSPEEDAVTTTISAVSTNTFAKFFGQGDETMGRSVVKTYDGGYAFAGTYGDGPMRYFYIVKTDRYGFLQWEKKLGSNDSEYKEGDWLRQTPDSGFVMIGRRTYTSSSYTTIIKLDKKGQVQWQGDYNYLFSFTSIALSSDYGYVGISEFSDDTSHGTAIFKLNSAGILLWTKNYPSIKGRSIERAKDNGYIIAGTLNSDLLMLKVDAQGNQQWRSTFGGPYEDIGNHAIQTADGGYLAVGRNGKDADNLIRQIYLVKVNSQGKYQWIKGNSPSNGAYGYRIRETSDRGFAISAYAYSRQTLIRVNSSGTFQWRKVVPNTALSYLTDLIVDSDGGYVLTGFRQTDPYLRQAALVKTDSQGNL